MDIKWKIYLVYGLIFLILAGWTGWLIVNKSARKWEDKYIELEGQFKSQKEAYESFREEAAERRKWLGKKRDLEKEKREERDVIIAQIEEEKRGLVKDLHEAEKRIKAAPDTDLVIGINKRIGQESRVMESGLFEFTRKGAEKTLYVFEQEKFNMKNYNKQLGITKKLEDKVLSFKMVVIPGYEEELKLSADGLAKVEKALDTCDKGKAALKKAFERKKWADYGRGAGTILVVVGILRLLKVF